MANLHEFIPPAFAVPIRPLNIAIFIFLEEIRSKKIKYAEKRIIIEVVDRYIRRSDDPGPGLLVS